MYSLLRDSESPSELRRPDTIGEHEAHDLVEAERLRIARELHDVVAHGLATISLQAGVAAHLADAHPEQAVLALAAIRAASRDVLGELRGILGQLRDDDRASQPARGVGRIDVLVESTSGAGVQTSVQVAGRPRPVPVEVDLAAYRIAQEALANVLRHAPGATASVSISYERHHLLVTIEDDGRGFGGELASEGCGYGIVGMRERVLALDGELEAGPRPGGGFRVRALLPYLRRS
jgi:signal transduction histidine kinase